MTQKCKWIKLNEVVEVQGIKLTRGGFYLGDRFVFDNIADGVECDATYTSRFSILPELNISKDEIKKRTLGGAVSYQSIFEYERFLYLKWLSQSRPYDKLSSRTLKLRSQVIFKIYFAGLQIRMFVDSETTMEERVELLLYANKLRNCAKQANLYRELDEFINQSVAKYFINNNNVTSKLKGSIAEENDRYRTQQIEKFIEQNKIKKFSATKAFDLCANVLNINFEPQQYTKSRFKTQWDKLSKELTLGEESSCRYCIAQEVENISIEIYKTKYSSHIILGIIKQIHADISRRVRTYHTTAESFKNQDFSTPKFNL
ncbi:MAG: hypothetical protein SNJ29_11490 [Rikenellaceae bacterium]